MRLDLTINVAHHGKPLDPTIVHYVNVLRFQLPNETQRSFHIALPCHQLFFKENNLDGRKPSLSNLILQSPRSQCFPCKSDIFAARNKQKSFQGRKLRSRSPTLGKRERSRKLQNQKDELLIPRKHNMGLSEVNHQNSLLGLPWWRSG